MSKILLNKDSVLWAIEHLSVYGDTDIFPRPIELKFFSEMKEEIATDLSSNVDLTAYKSAGILESLVPKSKVGFRIGHQPHPLDTLVLTASMYELGAFLEDARRPFDECTAFSYRFRADAGGSMFASGRKFSNWLEHQLHKLLFSNYTHVVKTDISDFFKEYTTIGLIIVLATIRTTISFPNLFSNC